MTLFEELKRRNVFRVAVAYIVVGWLVLQVADVVLNNIEAPGWVFQVIMLLLFIGFPVVMVFAWAFEMTPEGLKRESEVDRSESIAPQTGRKLDFTIIGILVLTLGYFAYDKFVVSAEREAELVEAATQAVTGKVEADEGIDRSIAVLPFADMSPDQDQEYFTDGLSEELLNLLAKIPELKVASRSSSFQFRDKGVDILDAASQLNVAHILEGSVRKDGNQLRITAQLIKADDGFHMWSETYDRELNSVFAIQDEISRAVVDALKVTLLGEAPRARETNPEAYANYLQGKYFFNLYSEENYQKSVSAYQAALAADPDYAPAFAGLSEVYLQQTNYGYINAIEGMVLTRSMSERAISLDQGSAEAWAALARIRWSYDWDWKGSEDAVNRALALEPGNAEVLTLSARIKSGFGHLDEAIALQRHALSLDPLNLETIRNLGVFLKTAGQMEESEATFNRLVMLNPQWPTAHTGFAEMLLLKGDPEGALHEARLESHAIWRAFVVPLAYSASGQSDRADEALARFIEDYGSVGAYQVAEIYAFRNEADLAFEWLERAYAQRDGGMTELAIERLFVNLHDDPRWEGMLDKMDLLEYWREMNARGDAS